MNVSILCRTCMKELPENLLHHFDERAIKMYKYCTKIVFDEVDALPKHFCTECTAKIKSTFNFIRKAQTANATLKKFILALNQPNSDAEKLKPLEDEINREKYKRDSRIELEQAIYYLETTYGNSIDDADEAVDQFFKNIEESAPIIGEAASETDEKSDIDQINHIYNFVAPLFIEKTNEDNNLLNDTPKECNNMITADTTIVIDATINPTTEAQTGLDLNKDNGTQNSTTSSAGINPNMIIVFQGVVPEMYDTSTADPIALFNEDNAAVNSTRNSDIVVAIPNVTEPYDTTTTFTDLELDDGANPSVSDINKESITNCPICGKHFPEGDEDLQEHLILDHPEENEEDSNAIELGTAKDTEIKCQLCPKIFHVPGWYNKHLEREHDTKIFKCKDCSKIYISYSSWQEHKKIHGAHRNCVCTICNKHFRKRHHLESHMITHTDERPYPCTKCHKTFKQKEALNRHIKIHEKDRKTVLCQYCARSFVTLRGLTEHMVRHTGSKPFECTECNFRAQYRTTLIRHKLRHTVFKPHNCKDCKRSFYTTDDLQRHNRSHTGDRPYKCPYCPRTFAEHNKRKTHLVSHHQLIFEEIPRLNRDGTPYVENNPGLSKISTMVNNMLEEQTD